MIRIISTLIFLLVVTLGFGQRGKNAPKRFKAGLIVGANLAQINGDLFSGYDKWGIQFGARGVMVLTPTLQASMELLYTQRGSRRPSARKSLIEKELNIGLTYAETPILLNLLFKEDPEAGFYRNHLHVGLSYSRLLKTTIEASEIVAPDDIDYVALVPFFNTNDLAVVAGLTHYLSKHLGVTIRHTISIKTLFENNGEDPTGRTTKWHSLFFSAQMVYVF